MNLLPLFEPQRMLDERIAKEKGLVGKNLILDKTNALICELWECMNESRVFKFWSDKRPDREKMLEEYADVIHFIISIANDFDYKHEKYEEISTQDIRRLANGITNLATLIPVLKNNKKLLKDLFNHIIKLGYQLGFTEEDVINAYHAKNKINHERQTAGY